MYASFGVQLLVFIPNIFVNMTVYLLFTYVDVVMKCLKFKKKKKPKKTVSRYSKFDMILTD